MFIYKKITLNGILVNYELQNNTGPNFKDKTDCTDRCQPLQ